SLGAPGGGVSFNGGTLATTAQITTARAFTLNAGGGTFAVVGAGTNLLVTGTISGVGRLTKANSGTLDFTNATNSYSGGTTLQAGRLVVTADAELGSAAADLTLNGGSLVTTASFASSRPVRLAGGAFDVFPLTTLTLSGPVGGTGGLIKNNNGTLVLAGNNT